MARARERGVVLGLSSELSSAVPLSVKTSGNEWGGCVCVCGGGGGCEGGIFFTFEDTQRFTQEVMAHVI